MSYFPAIQFGDSGNLDAFSRIRVSEPDALFSTTQTYNVSPDMEAINTSDGVAPSFSTSTRMTTLQINSGATGGQSALQSFQYWPYQPGRSQLIAITGVFGTATTGAVKRFGYGDASNGIFYEQNGASGLQVNRRTSTSGSVVDNTVAQASWNIDKMDGTGPSGITLDVTKAFILIIDLQYLGMGRVRIGFDINGIIYYVHQFLNANSLTVPYMQQAALPILVEIKAAAGLAGPATAYFKCASVMSEGGTELGAGYNNSIQGTVTAASGSRTHILSVRPLTTFNTITNRIFFQLDSIEIVGGANPVYWELCAGVTFSVAPTFASVNTTYSAFEAGTGGTFSSLSSGVVIASGYVASSTSAKGSVSKDLSVKYPISLNAAGAVRALGTLSLLVTGIGGTSACQAAFNWREIR